MSRDVTARPPAYRQVFVLCTGRCGSLTFAEACRAIDNYTSAHEGNLNRPGAARLDYPVHHIEIDNRLAWFLGRLHERYGDDAFYVHLQRDTEATARSYARRRALGFLLHAWMRGIYVGLDDVPDHVALARDLVESVNANIRLFLAGRPHRMAFHLERAQEDLPVFWERIGATGDPEAARAAWAWRHNASVTPAACAAAPALRPPVADTFPANQPLPDSIRALMEQRLSGTPPSTAQPSVTGRHDDLQAHLTAIAADFAGSPALCRHVAELIVRIRRGVALEIDRTRLLALVQHPESADFLARTLSLRWLVSLLDTLADHAPLAQAAGALALSTLVNVVKLAETGRLIMAAPAHDAERVAALAAAHPTPLFGGLNAFRLESGDMVRNLFARFDTLLADEPFLYAAFARVREELRRAPNLLERIAGYHPALF